MGRQRHLQAKHEEALAAAAAEKAAVEEAKAAVEASLAERQAEVEGLQGEVAGLQESLAALQAQLGEPWGRCMHAGRQACIEGASLWWFW